MTRRMSSAERGLWVAALLTLMLAHAGDALKCFSCSSNTDSRCKDYFDKSQHALKDCDIERHAHSNMEPYCTKVIYSENQNQQQNDTLRMCGWGTVDNPDSICQEVTPNYSHQLHCSVCRTDACNGAPGSALPSVVACLLPAAVAAFFKTV